jgi:alanine racemase
MHSGADMFAVANVAEAAAVREIGPGWPILVLGPLLPEEEPAILEFDLTPAISSEDEFARLEALAAKSSRKIPVHLKIDTGMAGARATGLREGGARLLPHRQPDGRARRAAALARHPLDP